MGERVNINEIYLFLNAYRAIIKLDMDTVPEMIMKAKRNRSACALVGSVIL